MFIDAISSSNMPNYTCKQPTHPCKLTNGKRPRPTALCGLNATL
ncbi:hypothetical protein HMPREF1991_01030 [Hoylesella loescheii DSM 19665 = JCM 12249 = ATCC 15930]|uniref:Uncharacterized protein n=1 Tax=Hoylesella loescheii DSM 19665 = JCM 12249 = ATCC 15930 TaxID=1122985 RepID=A0A069QSP8_HOYLO|nr:hypothetical protein HMPREF1991_01030 [Hoylesella loescheii DSM 19665 = JCM 12249 = ATCC 15930]